MSSINNNNNNNMNTTIVCIPGVFPNIGEDRIRRAFADLDIGEITRVDIVKPTKHENSETQLVEPPKNKKALNRVFVHLKLNTTPQAVTLKSKLSQGKQVKIVYDNPWFWTISLYKKKEKAPEQPKQFKHKKATLKFEDDEDEEQCPAAVTTAPVLTKEEKNTAAAAAFELELDLEPDPYAHLTYCHNCLQNGHTIDSCEHETVCSSCLKKGHTSERCMTENKYYEDKPIVYDLQNQAPPKKRKPRVIIDAAATAEKKY